MKLIVRLITSILLCASASVALNVSAADLVADKLKTQLQNQLGPNVKNVAQTPISGWYEVNLGGQLAYTDEKGRYLLVGDLIDLKTSKNLTADRLAELNKIDFASLPLEQAVKVVKGKGTDAKRRIAVFSDPNCPYCKKLEKTLAQLNNVTVYTFLFPILSPDSHAKSQAIWCAADRGKAWQAWTLHNQVPTANTQCDTNALKKNLELGHKLNIMGTPTVFFTNGRRLSSAPSVEKLEAEMMSK